MEVWQSGQMRQTVNLLPSGYVRFESHNFHNERRNSSLTYWYIKNYPPRSGIGAERLTIHDPSLNDVRVVLPAATLARFEKNYLSLYTDISADVYRLVGAVGSVFIPVFSSVGRAYSAGGHPYSTVRRRGDSCGEYDDGSNPSAPTKT